METIDLTVRSVFRCNAVPLRTLPQRPVASTEAGNETTARECANPTRGPPKPAGREGQPACVHGIRLAFSGSGVASALTCQPVTSPSPRASQQAPLVSDGALPQAQICARCRCSPTVTSDESAACETGKCRADANNGTATSSKPHNNSMVQARKSSPRLVKAPVPDYVLRVELQYVNPAIWRRIIVPGSIRLGKLHVLLLAMG